MTAGKQGEGDALSRQKDIVYAILHLLFAARVIMLEFLYASDGKLSYLSFCTCTFAGKCGISSCNRRAHVEKSWVLERRVDWSRE